MTTDPENSALTEPSLWGAKDVTAWRPADVQEALHAADTGLLMHAADLCEAMMTDERIRGVAHTRTNTLLGCLVSFKATKRAVEKAIATDFAKFAAESELGKLLRWGLQLGVGVAQVIWSVSDDGRWIPKLKTWHPRWLLFNMARKVWQIQTTTGLVDILPDDPNWTLFLPYGESRPWAEGNWRACALYWLGKLFAWRDWQKYNELHGAGVIKGKAPPGATDPAKAKFWNDLRNIGRNAKILLPEGFDLDMLEAMSTGWTTFPKTGEVANVAIAIVWLGQNLTTEVGGGSLAASRTHDSVRQDFLELDAGNEAAWFHLGVFRRWTVFNFGDGRLTPELVRDVKPPEDLKAAADILVAVANALSTLLEKAPQIDLEALLKMFNLPIREGASFEPVEPKPTPKPVPVQLQPITDPNLPPQLENA